MSGFSKNDTGLPAFKKFGKYAFPLLFVTAIGHATERVAVIGRVNVTGSTVSITDTIDVNCISGCSGGPVGASTVSVVGLNGISQIPVYSTGPINVVGTVAATQSGIWSVSASTVGAIVPSGVSVPITSSNTLSVNVPSGLSVPITSSNTLNVNTILSTISVVGLSGVAQIPVYSTGPINVAGTFSSGPSTVSVVGLNGIAQVPVYSTGPLNVAGTFSSGPSTVSVVGLGGVTQIPVYSTGPLNVAGTFSSGPSTVSVVGLSGVSQIPVYSTGPLNILGPTLTRGTQGSTGFSVQNLIDAGRTPIVFTATFTVTGAAEAFVSGRLGKNWVFTTTNSYTNTSGKYFRLQNLTAVMVSTGAARTIVNVYLKVKADGTPCALTDNSVWQTRLAFEPGTLLLGGGQVDRIVPFSDGLEFTSSVTCLAFSVSGNVNTGHGHLTFTGFEY